MERLEFTLRDLGESTARANSQRGAKSSLLPTADATSYIVPKTVTNKYPIEGLYNDATYLPATPRTTDIICRYRPNGTATVSYHPIMWWTPTKLELKCGSPILSQEGQFSTKNLGPAAQAIHVVYTDAGICPHFGTVAASSVTMPLKGEYDPQRAINCVYDPIKLASSCEALTAWTNYKRETIPDHSYYDDDLMYKMCGRAADPATCPESSKLIDPTTGKKICSNLIACPLCRQWATSTSPTVNREEQSDQLISDWCAAHTPLSGDVDDPTVADEACRCVNRARGKQLEPFLGAAGSGVINEASCWYAPCSTGNNFMRYLVPSDDRKRPCGNFCANIINFGQSQNIDISKLNMTNDCAAQIPPVTVTCPTPCYTGSCPAGCPSIAPPPQPNATCPSPCYAATCPSGCTSVPCPSPCYTGSCPAGCPSTTPPAPATDPEWIKWVKANKKLVGVGVGGAGSLVAVLVLFKMLATKKN